MADNPNAAKAIRTNYSHGNVKNVQGRAALASSNRAPLGYKDKKIVNGRNAAKAVPGGYRKTRKRSTRRR